MSWTYARSSFGGDHLGDTLFTYEGESEEDASEVKAVLVSLGSASIEQEDRFLYVSMPAENLHDALKELADANFADITEE